MTLSPRLHFDLPGINVETIRLIGENSKGEENIFLNFNEFVMLWFNDSERNARMLVVQSKPVIHSGRHKFPEGDFAYLITFANVKVFFDTIERQTELIEDERQQYTHDIFTKLFDQMINNNFNLYNVLTIEDTVQRGIQIKKIMSPKPQKKRRKKNKKKTDNN